jgi:hypothetical protein
MSDTASFHSEKTQRPSQSCAANASNVDIAVVKHSNSNKDHGEDDLVIPMPLSIPSNLPVPPSPALAPSFPHSSRDSRASSCPPSTSGSRAPLYLHEETDSEEVHDDSGSSIYNLVSEIFAPPERYLAVGASSTSLRRRPLSQADQRHPGKAGVRISRNTRLFEPDAFDEKEEEHLRQIRVAREEALAQLAAPEPLAKSPSQKDEGEYLSGWPLILLLTGICLAVFLISLDRTIIVTVSPPEPVDSL